MMKKYLILLILFLFVYNISGQGSWVILHTNDTHSQIIPYQSKGKCLGGVEGRLNYINSVRDTASELLLVDAGDFSQGSPYFNLFHGYAEIELMNKLGYEVVTLGNHEFDLGVKSLKKRLKKADFFVVCANYKFKDKALSKRVKPYVVLSRGGYKIGIFGLTVDLAALTYPEVLESVCYLPPIEMAQKVVAELKNVHQCDLIICLSHLGYDNIATKDGVNDKILAQQVPEIDFIIGGHTHTKLTCPKQVGNTSIFQTGSKGLAVGRIVLPYKK